jgi:hypothetical protein
MKRNPNTDTGIDTLEQAAKSRLCRSGIFALRVTPDAKGPALRLAQASRKLGNVLLPARSAADPWKEAIGARARHVVEDLNVPTRSVGRRPFKPQTVLLYRWTPVGSDWIWREPDNLKE